MADHPMAEVGKQRQQHQQHHRQQQHQQPQQQDRESSSDSRPSFTGYWMAEKQGESAGRLQFVNEGPALSRQLRRQSSSSSPPSATEPTPQKNAADGGDAERQVSCESDVLFVVFRFHFRRPFHPFFPLGAYAPSIYPCRPS
ncbi:hypothetical protein LX36DRAFT_120662 [Colletotrichum falcatum]|nr:hypothetical protein LX36DRAFT_120662 [Colletotrichum falcatum]